MRRCQRVHEEDIPFFFFSVLALVARFAVFSLGMVKVGDGSREIELCQWNRAKIATGDLYCSRGLKVVVVGGGRQVDLNASRVVWVCFGGGEVNWVRLSVAKSTPTTASRK
jgi:hypothetical protein